MSYTTINKSGDYFNTKIFDGNSTDNRTITGVGFQPDFSWIKCRNNGQNHNLFDAIRGATKVLESNGANAENTDTTSLKSFTSDGFTLGTGVTVNGSSKTYASWNWKAGTTSGITTDGNTTITPSSYSLNQTAGFSILKFTGNGVTGAKLAHGLGGTPANIVIKKINGTGDWTVYHKNIATGKNMWWNYTQAETADNLIYSPDATNITLLNHSSVNTSGTEYIAYCWKEVIGYSKFSSYTGNGADQQFIYTGFAPSFLLVKGTSHTSSWMLYDKERLTYNATYGRDRVLYPNANYAEANMSADGGADFLSNGFCWRGTASMTGTDEVNESGHTYVYMAFGQSLVGSNNVPCTAR